MLIDGIQLAEGSDVSNLTVATGASFPSDPSNGEFFLKSEAGIYNLYIYHTGTWNRVADQQSIQDTLGYTPVNKAGDTMSGILTLSGAPTLPLHAATKAYVDSVSGGGVSDANDLTGTTLAPNVVNSSLTSVGTLSSLSVMGNITSPAVTGTTAGHDISIRPGNAEHPPYGGYGASTSIYSGDSLERGGEVGIYAGNGSSVDGVGGNTTLRAGSGKYGGWTYILGGNGNGAAGEGGSIVVQSGPQPSVAGVGGDIILNSWPYGGQPVERLRIKTNGAWSVGSDGTSYGTSGQVLTSNGDAAPTWQTIAAGVSSFTVTGDVTGTLDGGTDALTLATTGVAAGTYRSVTVDVKGRVLDGTNPTTLAGYGITDAASSTHNHDGTYQPIDADLTAIAALAGTSGLLSKTAANTWALDTNTYLTSVPAQSWSSITSKPTTLSGYGITDAQPLDTDLTAIAALAGTSGFLKKTGTNTWALDTNTYGVGTVTSVSFTAANGFTGSVATSTTTPAISIGTSISGMLKGLAGAVVAASAGTDYSVGTSALATGILKNTNGSGATALSIAVAADFPTLNQNTTGSAASAGVATNTSITDDIATNSTMYPTWVTTTTGSAPQKVSSTKFTFNPATGTVTTQIASIARLILSDSAQSITTAATTTTTPGTSIAIAPGGSVDGAGAGITITGGATTGTGNAGGITIAGGQASGTTKNGGSINIVGGAGTANGGSITISGAQTTTTTGTPGDTTIQGGQQANTGSGVIAGSAYVKGGTNILAAGTAGNAVIDGGLGSNTTSIGGSVLIRGGLGGASGTGGAIILSTAATNSLTERLRILANGSWTLAGVAGTAGQVLMTNGASAPTWSGAITLTGHRQNVVDKGTISTGTVTFDYSGGTVQRLQVGGALTITVTNWPASGNRGYMTFKLVNAGSAVVTITPTINWVKPDGTFTTSIATYMTSIGRTGLQSAGTDHMVWWTDDAGTTIYGKMI